MCAASRALPAAAREIYIYGTVFDDSDPGARPSPQGAYALGLLTDRAGVSWAADRRG